MEKLKQIEAYLNNELNAEQKLEVEQRIADDMVFAHEVQMHKEVNQAIQEDGVVDFRKYMAQRYGTAGHIGGNIAWLKRISRISVAAVIMLLIGFSSVQLYRGAYRDQAYNKYYSPYQSGLVTRSAEPINTGVQVAYVLYDEGDYATSAEILKNYLDEHSNDVTARFYFGLNALELGLKDLAIAEFQRVSRDSLSPFVLHAKWYLALCYFEREDYDQASPLLNDLSEEGNMYAARARKLKRALN